MNQEKEPYFTQEEFDDFNKVELAEFYGFLYGLNQMRGDDMPLLLVDLYNDTRREFVRRNGEQFTQEFETILNTKPTPGT